MPGLGTIIFATVNLKMSSIDKMVKGESFQNMAKRERLMVSRERQKLEKVLGGIADLNRLPAALFVVDVKREHIAVKEAQKLNIPVFGIVDTNSDPSDIDFPIPGNDDAYKAIAIMSQFISSVIEEGLEERKKEKDESAKAQAEEDKKAMDEKREEVDAD